MLLRWARALDPERVWAIEDCRHVSGAFERFLIARGERIVRVAPKHMAGARRSSRERGKSDSIDAFSVARAALKEGIENLPGAHLDGAALDIRLLVDHREDLIAARTADQQRLRWHLHDPWPELEIPAGALDTRKWLGRISRRLARAQQTTRVRVARELVRQITARTTRIRELQAELAALVEGYAPQLLAERGCGPLTAAKLIREIAGAVSSPRAAAVNASTAAQVCVRVCVSVPITIIRIVPSIVLTRRTPADTSHSGLLPSSYQVTPAVLGRRRATRHPVGQTIGRQKVNESARRRPGNQPERSDVTAQTRKPSQ